MIAIINTVDSAEKFVKRGVYLFETRMEAKLWAIKIIRKYYPDSFREVQDSQVLREFHHTLNPTEFFHIETIRSKIRT